VQVGSLTQHYQAQEAQLQHGTKELQIANAISAEEASKCKAAKEVIRCLTMQVGCILKRRRRKRWRREAFLLYKRTF
jgi:hypothetical protein